MKTLSKLLLSASLALGAAAIAVPASAQQPAPAAERPIKPATPAAILVSHAYT